MTEPKPCCSLGEEGRPLTLFSDTSDPDGYNTDDDVPIQLPVSEVDENQLKLEELEKSLNSLLITLKCPVCLVLVEKDNKLCVNGHATCSKCLKDLKTCPTCREAFSNIKKNTVFSQILEDVPHPCRFDKCSQMVKSGDDHEVYCGYRPTRCQHLGCGWDGSVDNLAFHMEDKHPKEKVYSGTKNEVKFSLDSGGETIMLVSACGHYFWQKIMYFESSKMYTFSYIPLWVGKPTRDIYFMISFRSEGKEYDLGSKIKVSGNNAHNKDVEFTVPKTLLLSFCCGNELKFHLLIANERNEVINMLQE